LRPIESLADHEDDEGRQLAESVWNRLEPLVSGARLVFVVPDGRLHRVPWAGLPDPQHEGRFLAERFAFVSAAYGQQLLQPPGLEPPQREQLLLVGNVDFGGQDQPSPTWASLPGTRTEIERIAAVAAGHFPVRRLEGSDADKSGAVAELARSRWIHLATHGFFRSLPDAPSRGLAQDGALLLSMGNMAPPGVWGRNPLLRSGLVLAGANAADAGRGSAATSILSGEEVLHCDLSGAELVVLSACDTNVGVAAGGEGVFALQRAFHGAGARTVVASLWKVDDWATAAFMEEFYRQLLVCRQGRAEAFRQAQLAMLRRYDPASRRLRPESTAPSAGLPHVSPAYWAAFVLSGDWR
jgi:CHAT domain-containing protein